MKIKAKRKSLFAFYVVQFMIYALVVLGIVSLTNLLIGSYIVRKHPNLYSLTKYKSFLQNEQYDKIPPKNLNGCIYLIFDEYGNKQYAFVAKDAPKELAERIQVDFKNSNQKDFVLFNNQRVFQHHFVTNADEKRVLLLIVPVLSTEVQKRTIQTISVIWICSILLLLICTYLQILYCLHVLKQNTKPFKKAIQDLKSQQPLEMDISEIPKELDTLVEDIETVNTQLIAAEKDKNAEKEKRDRIIANISHDLKSPLTSIQGYAKAFCDYVIPKERQDEFMQLIYKKSLLSSALVHSLFDYAKMEHPDFRLNIEKLDFVELVREFISERYLEFEIRHFELDLHFPEKMIFANVDKALMRRVFYNLSENCLSYNPDRTKIFLEIQENEDSICLDFADNGNGIPPEIRKNIFEDFVIDKKNNRGHEQTGFGFPIVKRIIELHEGTISLVESPKAPFRTEFKIVIPKAKANSKANSSEN